MTIRTRFAPTPSGFLHWGNAFSFLLTWLYARKHDGDILLRIDDLDGQRKRPEHVEDVFRSLEWLGLDFDRGPTGPDEFESKFSQHHRLDLYEARLQQLREQSNLFGCKCSRSSIQRSPNGVHPESCVKQQINMDQPEIAWRMQTKSEVVQWSDIGGERQEVKLHEAMRDFVVRKKDESPAYQLASLVDDEHFDINLIVRGEDLVDSTAAQRFLAAHASESSFLASSFVHHRLVSDETGEKLSKSSGATSLKAQRAEDPSPANLYRRMSPVLGLSEPVGSAVEALAAWSPKTI